MTGSIAVRVARGAALLDEHEPGWADRIDLDKLDVKSPCDCVLGQLHPHPRIPRGSYSTGLVWFSSVVPRWADEEDYGFDDSTGQDDDYPLLTAAWRTLIESRRAGTP